ncbi:hypothetical protein [Nocardia xishanensis]|uniref:hypothetical protein n=1 Tax=Nocardia xishanensis TaxID=238964 RepID=UPI00342F73A7
MADATRVTLPLAPRLCESLGNLSSAVLGPLRDPIIADRLRADPTGVPAYLEEVLRYQGAVHIATARRTAAPSAGSARGSTR